MSIQLTILGYHSATPRVNSHTTSQLLEINNHHFLIDCGEGSQVQMRKHKVSFAKINHIFISHLHGDHFYGLIGLISTFGLLNRKKELHIYGPKGLKEIIELQLRITQSRAVFPIVYHELTNTKSDLIFEDKKVSVYTIPLKHRIYTNGFLFKEKIGLRKLNITAVNEYPEIEICDYHNIKNGKDYLLKNGNTIKNETLTLPPPKPASYAFCSDTAFLPSIVKLIKGVDTLYHEATFLSDRQDLAIKTGHSTAKEAAQIAKLAQVKRLILGHFSSRYKDLSVFEKEATQMFSNVQVAVEGANIVD